MTVRTYTVWPQKDPDRKQSVLESQDQRAVYHWLEKNPPAALPIIVVVDPSSSPEVGDPATFEVVDAAGRLYARRLGQIEIENCPLHVVEAELRSRPDSVAAWMQTQPAVRRNVEAWFRQADAAAVREIASELLARTIAVADAVMAATHPTVAIATVLGFAIGYARNAGYSRERILELVNAAFGDEADDK